MNDDVQTDDVKSDEPTGRTPASGPITAAPNPWLSGTTLGAGVVVAVVLWLMVNYLGMRHYQRFDWTQSQLFTLSTKTENMLRDLDQDVQFVMLIDPGSEVYTQMDELLDRYVAVNPARIVRRDLDRAKNRLEAQKIVDELQLDRSGVIVVASGGDKRVIDQFELVEYDYSGANYGEPPTIREFKGEQQLTSAILSLVEAERPKVVVTAGHGETPFDGSGQLRTLGLARDFLGDDNFEIETWKSLGADSVPVGTDLLVIVAPTAAFAPPELDVISSYLEEGGRLLVFLEPSFVEGTQQLAETGLADLLSLYGIEIRRDVVVDPGASLALFGPETIYTDRYGSHPVVDALSQTARPVLFAGATSVTTGDAAGVELVELVRTTAEAWGETDLENLEQVAPDGDDLRGPFPLAVAAAVPVASYDDSAEGDAASAEGDAGGDGQIARMDFEDGAVPEGDPDGTEDGTEDEASEARAETRETRLVVFGDVDFASDQLIGQGGNSTLLLNTFNWLVERRALIDVEAREPVQTSLVMSRAELVSLNVVVVLIMPLSAVFLGVWIGLRRRR